ncbi:MAG TPA: redoxin domain-containing protein, partial [bacterium]|nr:redoxin domain-containing protein [bacterium]
SPTYFVILAVVLPQSFWIGLLNLIFYAAGLVLVFSFVGLLGQRYLRQIKWISNPKGYFKKVLGATFIILGIFIIAGIDKKVETYILDLGFLDITNFETMLLSKLERESPNKDIFTQEDSKMKNQEIMLNVKYPYKAPSFVGLTSWFNSEPLELEDLKGKVVIVDFWTYSCINCIRTLPYLEKWHEKYSGQGLVIIGVHSPEFVFEKVPDNVEGAVKKYGLQYPIALDSDFKTWRAYDNHYWPAKYFIDKDGKVRHTHFGEGAYEESELIIRQLLGELNEGSVLDDELVSENKVSGSVSSKQSPETYLNYERGANLSPVNANEFAADKEVFYSIQTKLSRNEWSLGGTWLMGADHSEARAEGAKLKYNFSAKEVYLVMGPSSIKSADAPKSYKVKVFLNGEAINVEEAGSSVNSDGIVIVDRHDLYKLVNLPEFASDQILELQFDSGVEVNAFTFGS